MRGILAAWVIVVAWLAQPTIVGAQPQLDCQNQKKIKVVQDARQRAGTAAALQQLMKTHAGHEEWQCLLWDAAVANAATSDFEACKLQLEDYQKKTGSYQPPYWYSKQLSDLLGFADSVAQNVSPELALGLLKDAQIRAFADRQYLPWYLAILHVDLAMEEKKTMAERTALLVAAANDIRDFDMQTNHTQSLSTNLPRWRDHRNLNELTRNLIAGVERLARGLREHQQQVEALRVVKGIADLPGMSPILNWYLAILFLDRGAAVDAFSTARIYLDAVRAAPEPPLQLPDWGYPSVKMLKDAVRSAMLRLIEKEWQQSVKGIHQLDEVLLVMPCDDTDVACHKDVEHLRQVLRGNIAKLTLVPGRIPLRVTLFSRDVSNPVGDVLKLEDLARPLELNPGTHRLVLTFAGEGAQTRSETWDIRLRPREHRFGPPRTHFRWPAIVLGVVGVGLGAVAGIAFSLHDFVDPCVITVPKCMVYSPQFDQKPNYGVGSAMAAIGGAALVGAGVLVVLDWLEHRGFRRIRERGNRDALGR